MEGISLCFAALKSALKPQSDARLLSSLLRQSGCLQVGFARPVPVFVLSDAGLRSGRGASRGPRSLCVCDATVDTDPPPAASWPLFSQMLPQLFV